MHRKSLTLEQRKAIGFERSLGSELAKSHPEIVEIYLTDEGVRDSLCRDNKDFHLSLLNGRRAQDIGDRFISSDVSAYQRMRAVTFALEALLSTEERGAEFLYRQTLAGYARDPSAFSVMGERGGKSLHDKYPGLWRQRLTPEAIAQRNRNWWSSLSEEERVKRKKALSAKMNPTFDEAETKKILEMIKDPSYHYSSGHQTGRPNLKKIALDLSKTKGTTIDSKMVYKAARRHGYQPAKCARMSEDERAEVIKLCNSSEFLHDSGRDKGKPMYGSIASHISAIFGVERASSTIRYAHIAYMKCAAQSHSI